MNDAFNIVDLFAEAANKNPTKAAIIFNNKTISFGELEKQVNETANYFIEKGIEKGDRVFVFVPMSMNLYRIVLALFKIGATAVFIDEWVSSKRMQECCKVAQCKAIIGILKIRLLSNFLPELRKISIKLGTNYSNVHSNKSFPATNKSDTALITFTTGSTGTPKAAKRTHEFLFHQFEALIKIIQPQHDDVDMPVLPIVLLINLGTGTTSVIANYKSKKPNLFKPEKVISQIKKYSVNRITASPFFIKQISKYLMHHNISIDNIRKIFTGGAPVFPKDAELFIKAFTKANIKIIYGSTEAEPISMINANELKNEQLHVHSKGLNVGKIDNNIEIRIIKIINANIAVDAEDELLNITLPANETGEIIVKGKHVLNEYFNNGNALKRNKIFIGDVGWHRTGDCGYLDETGILYLTGRCTSLINNHGKYLSPFIYENYFQSINGVETGTIFLLNNKIIAVIELKNQQKRDSVKNIIKENNSELDDIVFIKKIPKDSRHNTKIDYDNLSKSLLRL